VIVVVGGLGWRQGDPAGPAGRACEVALAAAAAGARVEIVARAGDDATGDALMLALSRAGIGHVAVLRDPSHPTPILPALGPVTDDGPVDLAFEVAAEPPQRQDPAVTGPVLDAADVSLGLQYLTAFGVLVVTDDVAAPAIPVAVEAAGYAGAHLVLLVSGDPSSGAAALTLPPDATVLAVPADDAGAFATLVGAYAAALDSGAEPAAAFAGAVGAVGGEALPAST
jgi:sugar/nucleoside kinase (ribokinase family)